MTYMQQLGEREARDRREQAGHGRASARRDSVGPVGRLLACTRCHQTWDVLEAAQFARTPEEHEYITVFVCPDCLTPVVPPTEKETTP